MLRELSAAVVYTTTYSSWQPCLSSWLPLLSPQGFLEHYKALAHVAAPSPPQASGADYTPRSFSYTAVARALGVQVGGASPLPVPIDYRDTYKRWCVPQTGWPARRGGLPSSRWSSTWSPCRLLGSRSLRHAWF